MNKKINCLIASNFLLINFLINFPAILLQDPVLAQQSFSLETFAQNAEKRKWGRPPSRISGGSRNICGKQ